MFRSLSIGLVGMASTLVCCSSAADDFCQKSDACNLLVGQSVDECASDTQARIDKLPEDKRPDCEQELSDCR